MITLRPATEEDAELLFGWRNDPLTRANSHNMGLVPWDDHVKWLRNTLARDDRHLLIGEKDGTPIGTVRFDALGDHYEISWTGAPETRGKGYAKAMAIAACSTIKKPIVAEIKVNNAPTINMIQACGFVLQRESDGLGFWRREAIS